MLFAAQEKPKKQGASCEMLTVARACMEIIVF